MKQRGEFLFYVSVGAGMALATISFTMLSGLFEAASGGWVVLGMVLGGVMCGVIAASVGELAGMFPSAPGIRTYLKAAFGNRPSLFLVHLYLIFLVMIAGAESYLFSLVVEQVAPGLPHMAVILVLLGSVVLVNLYGLELPRNVQMVTAFVLLGILCVTGIAGILAGGPAAGGGPAPEGLGLSGSPGLLPLVATMAIFLYVGFEWVTPLGLRPNAYERPIPLAMLTAILANVVACGLFASGMATTMPREAITATFIPQVPYLGGLLGRAGVWLAVGVSCMACISTFNAGIMGSSRLIFALTRESLLPKWAGTINPETGAPRGAVLFMGALAAVSATLVVALDAPLLAALIGSAIIAFVYAAFMLAVLRLRRLKPAGRRPFRTPLPAGVQWAFAGVLPLLGVGTLFELEEQYPWQAVAGFLLALAAAALLTRWSEALSRPAAAPAARAVPEEAKSLT
ncbi:MAG TPA: APC family permease [Longimicrobium sp.]|nr:APC family permease [Longimicrobium sp.]